MPALSELLFGIIFSILGMVYIVYGRKNNFYFLLAGFTLLAVSFFSLDLITYLITGVVLAIAPFLLTHFLD
jgi:hypothetical protein